MGKTPVEVKKGSSFSCSFRSSPDRAGQHTEPRFMGNQVLSAPDSSSYLFQSVLSFLQGTTKVGSRGWATVTTPSDSLRFIFCFLIQFFLWLLWALVNFRSSKIFASNHFEFIYCFVVGGPLVFPTILFLSTSLCSLNLTYFKSHLQ